MDMNGIQRIWRENTGFHNLYVFIHTMPLCLGLQVKIRFLIIEYTDLQFHDQVLL